MTLQAREDYIHKANAQIQEWKVKLENREKKAKEVEGELKEKYAQIFVEIRDGLKNAQNAVHEFEKTSLEKEDAAKRKLDEAFRKVKNTFKHLKNNFPKI